MNIVECEGCGTTFQSTTNGKGTARKRVCDSCLKQRAKDRMKVYWQTPQGKNRRIILKERIAQSRRDGKGLTKPCFDCGKSIQAHNTRCRACHCKYARRENANNWQGGRVIMGDYAYIFMREHPRANKYNGYVREHLIVWEQFHKKELPEGWMVHHLNGIKDDNRIENLVRMPNKKHYLVLQAKAKRIQELEALLRQQGQLI